MERLRQFVEINRLAPFLVLFLVMLVCFAGVSLEYEGNAVQRGLTAQPRRGILSFVTK